MNVIVANERQNELTSLDIDIIKSITGSFEVNELIEMFKNFFFNKMILDVTSLKGYTEIDTYGKLINGLDKDKIIFLLPAGSTLCKPLFLGQLISLGIYNFTIDLNGIRFLLKKPNTLEDVIHIQKAAETEKSVAIEGTEVQTVAKVDQGVNIVGFKNVTPHAGATSLIYMLKKELSTIYGNDKVVAIELNKGDFFLFGDKNMISTREADITSAISRFKGVDIFLIDLNDCTKPSFCKDIIYLLEPGTIKINKLVRRGPSIFKELSDKKVVLNQSLLQEKDVSDFESESGLKIFYNLPPLDDRKKNDILNDFSVKIGLVNRFNRGDSGGGNKGFGLFRH